MPEELPMKSFSIEEWCKLHGFSRSFFYKLKKEQMAPRCFKVGTSTRITEAANNEWITAREAVAA